MPKRPKGRWFVAALLFSSCGYGLFSVWDAFFRYRAYGTVTGRTVQVSASWPGSVAFLHVREGEKVRQGQLLVTLESPELRDRKSQLQDEIRLAQAAMEGEAARLKWQAAFHLDDSTSVRARYHEMLGQLLQEQARLDKLKSDLDRAVALSASRAISKQEFEQIAFEKQGQQVKIDKLKEAVAELRKRGDLSGTLMSGKGDLKDALTTDGLDQLKPFAAKIASLQSELARVEERLQAGRLRAPTNGLVVKLSRFAGEHCAPGESLLCLLEDGSLEVVLYLPQKASQQLEVGQETSLSVEPYSQAMKATVSRFGDRFENAPEALKRHYYASQNLLPVYLKPNAETNGWLALRVGATVKLP
jgi:HlyD family secretion protein